MSCLHLYTKSPGEAYVGGLNAAAVVMGQLLALLTGWLGSKPLDIILQLIGKHAQEPMLFVHAASL